MPVYDFECANGHVHEEIARVDIQEVDCPTCGGVAHRIISVGGPNCFNNDAGWLKTVVEVVNPDKNESSRTFKTDPTRENYRRWLKDNGLRPLENNERMKPEPMDMRDMNRQLVKRYKERTAIVI